MLFGFAQRVFIAYEHDGLPEALGLSPSLCSSANQDPASCHPMSLFSMLNISPPFVANVKSVYLSIRHKHDVRRGCLFKVGALCVEKHFPTSIWLHPPFESFSA